MQVIKGSNNVHTMLLMYKAVMMAPEKSIRSSKVRDLRTVSMVFDGTQPMLTAFEKRSFNLKYAKQEWLWYLGADAKDDSIEQHASMWKKLKQEDGSYYSNYGQYMFANQHMGRKSQFEYVINELKLDKDSRRASMVLLKSDHLYSENTDTVCTYAINFFVQDDQLCMNVHMRSNDVIFGFTNDAFCFHQLMMFVATVLSLTYPNLRMGYYTHIVDSLHVYDRHFRMIADIVEQDYGGYDRFMAKQPIPTAKEAVSLFSSRGQEGEGEYSDWLFTA